MRYLYILMGLLCTVSSPVLAQSVSLDECDVLLAKAELTSDEAIYDKCGFNDSNLAWSKWSGLASQKQWKKALYQLCVRYPQHEYSELYCEKSANLGYGPALAEQGHRAMAKRLSTLAVQQYTRALETRQLNDEQEGRVAESLGLYYMQNNTDYYAPSKAIAFFQNAATKRSALSNNVMGVLSYTGSLGVVPSQKGAFEYFWRAALLGCPAAEENIGLFHLARQDKISPELTAQNMEMLAFSCKKSSGTQEIVPPPSNCDCPTVMTEDGRFNSKPYYLLESAGTSAKLQDHSGATLTVQRGQVLTSGYKVDDIRATAAILTKGTDRVILNLYKPSECLSYCKKNPTIATGQVGNAVQIVPYRFSFSPSECRDIMYYAAALVDTTKHFIGKNQCATSEGIVVNDPLLQLMQGQEGAIDENASGEVGTYQNNQQRVVEPMTKNIIVPKRARPNLDRKYQVKRNIHSAASAKYEQDRNAALAEIKKEADQKK